MIRSILVSAALVALSAVPRTVVLEDGFLPKYNLRIPIGSSESKGIAEKQFNDVMDRAEAICAPVISPPALRHSGPGGRDRDVRQTSRHAVSPRHMLRGGNPRRPVGDQLDGTNPLIGSLHPGRGTDHRLPPAVLVQARDNRGSRVRLSQRPEESVSPARTVVFLPPVLGNAASFRFPGASSASIRSVFVSLR